MVGGRGLEVFVITCMKLVQPAAKLFGVTTVQSIFYYGDLTFMSFPGHLGLV